MDKSLTCLVLEWAAKGTLGDMLEDSKVTLRWEEPLLRLAIDIARGMSYLHSWKIFDERTHSFKEGVVHRDLKPDNCLITSYLSGKVSVF